jgi:hypothetical protein
LKEGFCVDQKTGVKYKAIAASSSIEASGVNHWEGVAVMPKKVMIDLSGKKIGKLTVIKRIDTNKHNVPIWLCVCDCGKEVKRSRCSLRGAELSGKDNCMCTKCRSNLRDGIDGKSSMTEYKTLNNMIQRCTNKNNHKYQIYGERGIKVCDRWLESFWNFYEDMGPKPSPKHSIDRIDVNGNYEPSNCRWATATEQSHNTRVFKTSSTGVNGVCYRPVKTKRWVARINVNNKNLFLGIFLTKEEAVAARKSAEQKYWGKGET